MVGTLRFTFTCGILQAFALQRFAHIVLLGRTPLEFYPLLAWGAGVVAWTWAVRWSCCGPWGWLPDDLSVRGSG